MGGPGRLAVSVLCSFEEGFNTSFIQLTLILPMILSRPKEEYFQLVFGLFLGSFSLPGCGEGSPHGRYIQGKLGA